MIKLTYLAHSAFSVEFEKFKILIDPFITGNPLAPVEAKNLNTDYIVLSHGHGDHLGDTIDIAKRCKSTVIAVNELANYINSKGVNAHNMHIGGIYSFPFGRVKFTIAHHGSSSPEGDYMGEPAGILLMINGKTLYHAGDTGLFMDMKLIGETNKIDVAMLPIGGNFTMDVDDAVMASEFLNAKLVIPMHFNTFPVIQADPDLFIEKVKKAGLSARKLNFGETIEL